ncbi:PDDEXK nuclease domain-containing protein [Arthrobacter sp. VKM Ac-2550]|uniref:PDDEXK nuclease domain-containing protein n=1 Tax=Crystallibacter permensis TaxID=1938888 RepID=UPI0039B4E5A0
MESKGTEESTARSKTTFEKPPGRSAMPTWYPDLLDSVASRVAAGRVRAINAANQELVRTYWAIGNDILNRQEQEGWGAKVIDRLSADLRDRFPEAKGFSSRNLKYMRSLAEAWPQTAIVQAPLAQLPWYHHLALLDKVREPATRLWYAEKAVEGGWSRNVLTHQIDSRLHERAGKATSNFKTTLPPSDSDLVQQATKDPYVFDFVAMTGQRNERELESQLIDHVQKFLLELGQGFAFVGRQIQLHVAGDEFFADLLFYNFKLRRFVVIELKAGKFDPGYLGQLGVYMSAVDDLLAQDGDKPTIGLLLCKSKNELVAEYALRGYNSPIGVANWAAELEESMPEEFAGALPTVDELEAELTAATDDRPVRDETK